MFEMAANDRAEAHQLYLDHSSRFPLIAAVLKNKQEGRVFADRLRAPRQVFVEHAFGFAQIFGAHDAAFERALQTYILDERSFPFEKLRLFTPNLSAFLDTPETHDFRAYRQHFSFQMSEGPRSGVPLQGTDLIDVTPDHLPAIQTAFGVATRFWRTTNDFMQAGRAVMASLDGAPAALCYGAACEDGAAEIDVLTLPAFREQGLARACVARFIARCLTDGITPMWDCFTNNEGSMALCRSIGFVPITAPYPFYTIARKSPS